MTLTDQFEKNKAWILVSIVILCFIVAFVAGYYAGEFKVCAKNNGTLVYGDNCVLDKCLEDMHVCEKAGKFYFVPDTGLKLNLSIGE